MIGRRWRQPPARRLPAPRFRRCPQTRRTRALLRALRRLPPASPSRPRRKSRRPRRPHLHRVPCRPRCRPRCPHCSPRGTCRPWARPANMRTAKPRPCAWVTWSVCTTRKTRVTKRGRQIRLSVWIVRSRSGATIVRIGIGRRSTPRRSYAKRSVRSTIRAQRTTTIMTNSTTLTRATGTRVCRASTTHPGPRTASWWSRSKTIARRAMVREARMTYMGVVYTGTQCTAAATTRST
mmetsp:Transcript_60665/g.166574  ORF Transcript_60665/g.166574 Transcript_60665/m.166574 type:complete len:236 (-) Transcript_60665:867-1574(-)